MNYRWFNDNFDASNYPAPWSVVKHLDNYYVESKVLGKTVAGPLDYQTAKLIAEAPNLVQALQFLTNCAQEVPAPNSSKLKSAVTFAKKVLNKVINTTKYPQKRNEVMKNLLQN